MSLLCSLHKHLSDVRGLFQICIGKDLHDPIAAAPCHGVPASGRRTHSTHLLIRLPRELKLLVGLGVRCLSWRRRGATVDIYRRLILLRKQPQSVLDLLLYRHEWLDRLKQLLVDLGGVIMLRVDGENDRYEGYFRNRRATAGSVHRVGTGDSTFPPLVQHSSRHNHVRATGSLKVLLEYFSDVFGHVLFQGAQFHHLV
jgi:hypothetical protein